MSCCLVAMADSMKKEKKEKKEKKDSEKKRKGKDKEKVKEKGKEEGGVLEERDLVSLSVSGVDFGSLYVYSPPPQGKVKESGKEKEKERGNEEEDEVEIFEEEEIVAEGNNRHLIQKVRIFISSFAGVAELARKYNFENDDGCTCLLDILDTGLFSFLSFGLFIILTSPSLPPFSWPRRIFCNERSVHAMWNGLCLPFSPLLSLTILFLAGLSISLFDNKSKLVRRGYPLSENLKCVLNTISLFQVSWMKEQIHRVKDADYVPMVGHLTSSRIGKNNIYNSGVNWQQN